MAHPRADREGGQALLAHPAELDQLTDRERELMAQIEAGLSNEEIATQLFVSPATTMTHVSRAMIKLDARKQA